MDQLRHDLNSPLTTIRGRAYLLARAVLRAPSLTEDERTRMLDGVAAIETAVAAMVVVIDAIDGDAEDGPGRPYSRAGARLELGTDVAREGPQAQEEASRTGGSSPVGGS